MAAKKKKAPKKVDGKPVSKKKKVIGLKELANDLRRVVNKMTEVMTDEEVLGLVPPYGNPKYEALAREGSAISVVAGKLYASRRQQP